MVSTQLGTHASGAKTSPQANGSRIPAVAAAVLGAGVSLISGIAFIAWVNLDNSITYPAEETGRAAAYPPNHALYGAALGVSLAAAVALTAAALWLSVDRSRPSVGRAVLIVLFAVAVGAVVPISIQYSMLLASPLLAIAVGAATAAAVGGRKSTHEAGPHDYSNTR